MASIKVKFNPSTLKYQEGTLYYQIIHDRKVKQLFTTYHLFRSEWDDGKSAVRIDYGSERVSKLLLIRERVKWDLQQLYKIVGSFEEKKMSYSGEDVAEEFQRYQYESSFFRYMDGVITKLRQNGKIRTSETYLSALSSFKKFRNEKDIFLHEISSEQIDDYEGWLYSSGIAANSVSFYMRILRATYNRAVDEGRIEDRRPFRHVYTGVDKTVKRALPINVLKKIRKLDLSLMPKLDYARDIFFLSFMLRGMNFVDMAFLKKSDLINGCISYRRRKTGQLLMIEWTDDMQLILNKYPDNSSDYLLPIMSVSSSDNLRNAYRSANSKVNYALKQIITVR